MSYTPLANIILSGDPRGVTATAGDNDTSLATTAFVQGELAGYLPLSGGTMTSDITLGSGVDINFNDTNSGLQWSDVRIDRIAADVIQLASGDQIRVQQDPVNDNDLARKSYVDAVVTGLDVKESVRAATTANITLSGAQTIDGVSLIAGDRVLVKNQTTAADNGIYVVAAGAWSRAGDADNSPAGEVTSGMFTFVEEGTLHGDEGWILTTNDPITLGVTGLAFTQFSSATVVSTLDSLTDVDTTGVVDGSLLRYEATGTVWNDTSTLLFNDNGQLQVTTTGSSAGLLLGGDALWYRSAADEMRTPDALVVDGTSTLTGQVSAPAGVVIDDAAVNFDNMAGGSSTIFDADVAGDTQKRVIMDADGRIFWGSGSAAQDVNLYRSAANVLKTDDQFAAAGDIIAQDGTAAQVIIGNEGPGSEAAIVFGSGADVNLYRSAANVLKTDDALDVAGRLIAEAGQRVAISSTKTANYTVALATDYIIRVDSSGGGFTVALPAGHSAGDTVLIKDVAGAAGTNNVIVDPNASETIDGAATFSLTVNYQAVTVVSDGTNWVVV